MSYLSNVDYGSSEAELGCGPDCKCGPCKSGLSGLDEWYAKEAEKLPQPSSPQPGQQPSDAQSLSGWADMDQRVVQAALGRGVRNLRQLTAAIFFARHPSQRAEWVQIRDRIARPALQQLAGRNGAFTNRGGIR
jgi:hypothetical protein